MPSRPRPRPQLSSRTGRAGGLLPKPVSSGWLLALLAVLLLPSFGCGAKYVRKTIHDDGDVSVVLRAEVRSGERFQRHFGHPATISSVRIAHILSRIDVRTDVEDQGGHRIPAIHTSLLYPLGDLLSEALAKAKTDEEVIVQAVRKEKRLGIFHQSFLTSLVTYVGGDDRLYVHLYRVEWPVPKTENTEIREPVIGREAMSFRVIPSDAMQTVSPQALAIEWRDPAFRKATNIRVGATGKVMRRTILLESGDEAAEDVPEEAPVEAIPSDPKALRALAELEEARTEGRITEAEYRSRRRALLRGETP